MSEFIQANQIIIYPIIIFFLKGPELCLNALRIILTAKGYKFLSAVLIFIEACLGLTALTLVFTKLNNPINILAYALGMASGSYLGIVLERKIALGVVLVRVITQLPADELLKNLRKLGFRVTEVAGQSNYSRVGVLFAVVKRNNIQPFIKIVTRYNPRAFYTLEEIHHVSQTIIKGGKEDDPKPPPQPQKTDPPQNIPDTPKNTPHNDDTVDSQTLPEGNEEGGSNVDEVEPGNPKDNINDDLKKVWKRSIDSLLRFFPIKI